MFKIRIRVQKDKTLNPSFKKYKSKLLSNDACLVVVPANAVSNLEGLSKNDHTLEQNNRFKCDLREDRVVPTEQQ